MLLPAIPPTRGHGNTSYHMLHPVYLKESQVSQSSFIIWTLVPIQLSTAPEPRILPCASPHADPSSMSPSHCSFPPRLTPKSLSHAYSPPCFIFLLCTSIKYVFLSLSTVYFPHKDVNWCKFQEGKECFLLYPRWPAQCLVHIKYSIGISCINKWQVHF